MRWKTLPSLAAVAAGCAVILAVPASTRGAATLVQIVAAPESTATAGGAGPTSHSTGARDRSPADTAKAAGAETSQGFTEAAKLRREMWLACQYELANRLKDAEAAYLRAAQIATKLVWEDSVSPGIKRVLKEQAQDAWSWAPRFLRARLVRLWAWQYLTDGIWLVGVFLVAGYGVRRALRWNRELRIEPFARGIPSAILLDPERMITTMHQTVRDVSEPMGLLSNSGLKLPVISTASAEDVIAVVEVTSPPKWLLKLVGSISKVLDRPRFVVSGHVEGTLTKVRLAANLHEHGRLVRSWDLIVPAEMALEEESRLACELLYTLSECTQ